VDKKVALECKEILVADLSAKLSRQQSSAAQLDILLDYLFETITYQVLFISRIAILGKTDNNGQTSNI
jgi:hypothetical protein